jgi:hypothetical protein
MDIGDLKEVKLFCLFEKSSKKHKFEVNIIGFV